MSRPEADVRDVLARAERRARRREIPTLVGVTGFGVLLAVAGRDIGGTSWIGAWVAVVGVLLWIGRWLRNREERGTGSRGRLATRTVDGESATVLHEHPARNLLSSALSAHATVPFVALLIAMRPSEPGAGDVVVGVVLFAALLVPVGLVLGGQVRRALRAGVWLTPSALVVRERDVTSRVRWQHVRLITEPHGAADTLFVMVWDRNDVTVVARKRREARFRGVMRDIPIRCGALTLDAPELVGLLRTCLEPGVADRLGTDAGLALVRGARRLGPR